MKYLVLLLIFLLLLAWLAFRFRRQIAVARQVWQMLLAANRAARQQAGAAQPQKQVPVGKLVRCEKCGTWVSEDAAISLGRSNHFCSAKCLEKAVVSE